MTATLCDQNICNGCYKNNKISNTDYKEHLNR